MAELPARPAGAIPSQDDKDLATYVKDLWEDAQQFQTRYYQQTKHLRRSKPDEKGAGVGFSFDTWKKAAEALAYGENWEYVWGHRPENWMKERVDGEIPRKISVRKDTIASNYHEFTISPNIANVNELYQQERKRMKAKDWMGEYVQTALVYGTAINEIVVDYNLHPQGQVRNIVRMDVGRTPGARSFDVSDGCNYCVFYETVTGQEIETDFPKIDVTELTPMTDSSLPKRSAPGDYKHTKFYEKFRVYIDDSELEDVPFGNEEQVELIEEQQKLTHAEYVKAGPNQNHMAHITAKVDALMNFLSVVPNMPDEELQALPTVGVYLENILEHLSFVDKNKIETLGKRQKYPHGRYICSAGNKIISDEPNPTEVPWRKLVRELQNRKVQNRIDAAGDPEAMYRESYQGDIMRSRIEELSLLGIPQVFRHISDKNNKEIEVKNDNDPLSTKYYVDKPPTIVKGDPPSALMRLYEIAQGKAEKDTGVNSVARGEQPQSHTPASLVAIVQKQNRVIVSGELDRNLREALEDIIEGNLAVMRSIYKEKRQYILNGKVQDINVSQLLSFIEIAEGGRREKVEVPMFEVTVKAGSNYPDEWETKLALLLNLRQTITDPAKMIALDEAIFDHLAVEYPEFGKGGPYRKLNEAAEIGLDILAKRQQAEEAQATDEERTKKVFQDIQDQADKQALEEQFLGGDNGRE